MRPRRGSRETGGSPCPSARAGSPSGTAQSGERELARVGCLPAELRGGGRRSCSPASPFSTTMFEISSSPVRAVIVTAQVSSVPAFVMNIFEPLTTQVRSRMLRCRAGGAGVRARVRLGEPERGQPAAGGEVREPPFLLLLGAEEVDRHRPERGVGGDGDRDGRVDPRQLLDRDRIGDGVAARAAVALVDRDAHQAEPGHLAHGSTGKRASRSSSSATGATRSRANERTVSRISSCSEVRSKSTPGGMVAAPRQRSIARYRRMPSGTNATRPRSRAARCGAPRRRAALTRTTSLVL